MVLLSCWGTPYKALNPLGFVWVNPSTWKPPPVHPLCPQGKNKKRAVVVVMTNTKPKQKDQKENWCNSKKHCHHTHTHLETLCKSTPHPLLHAAAACCCLLLLLPAAVAAAASCCCLLCAAAAAACCCCCCCLLLLHVVPNSQLLQHRSSLRCKLWCTSYTSGKRCYQLPGSCTLSGATCHLLLL